MHLSLKDLTMEEKQSEVYKEDLVLNNNLIDDRSSYNAAIEKLLCSFDESDEDEEPIDNRQD